MTSVARIPKREPLETIGKRLSAAMRSRELDVAREVIALADRWDDYRDEAGGLEIGQWLLKYVDATHGLEWYRTLVDRAKTVGDLSDRISGAAVRWLGGAVTNEIAMAQCRRDLAPAYRENGSMPLKLSQVRRMCERYATRGKSRLRSADEIRALKAHVKRLEAQVRELGAEPVE